MKQKIVYSKYESRGADFHYRQIDRKNIKEYNSYMSARHEMVLRQIESLINSFENQAIRLFDMGCGDGVLSYLLKNKFPKKNLEIFGVDLSGEAIEVARLKNENINFFCESVYNTHFASNYFDIIISMDVIEHLTEPEKMLQEIKRIAKDKADIIIGTPVRRTEAPIDKSHVKEYFPSELKDQLSSYFRVESQDFSHNIFYKILYERSMRFLGKDYYFWRYLINFLSIYLGKNLFRQFDSGINSTYMFVYCKKCE